MFTKLELTQHLDIRHFSSNDNEINFSIADMQFELQNSGLLTLLQNDFHQRKECNFKIRAIEDLISAINNIELWEDDWNE